MGLFGLGKPDIGKLKAKMDVNGLVAALNYTKEPQVAWAAMVALVQFGPAAIIPLRGAVYDSRSDHVLARRLAAIALGNLGDKEAVPALVEGMSYPNPVISKFSALALGMFGDPSAELRLMLIFDDPNENLAVRSSAADGLYRIGTDGAIRVLGDSASLPGTPALQAKCKALVASIGIGRAVQVFLPPLLNECSRPAADALELVGWKPADDREKIAYYMAKGLWDECAKMPEAVIAALSTPVAGARVAAATAMGKIGGPGAVDKILPLLGDKDEKVRNAAADALASLGDPAIGPLVVTLKSADKRPRSAALRALASIGAPAIEPIATALGDLDYYTLDEVVKALEGMGWKPGRSADCAAYWAWKREWDVCYGLGAPAAKAIVGFLAYYYTVDSEKASETLLRMVQSPYGPDVLEYLPDRLFRPDGSINYRVYEVIVKSGTLAVDPLCARLSSGQAVRKTVLEILGKISNSPQDAGVYGRIARHLTDLLADGDRDVRIAAANVVHAMGPGITDEEVRAKFFERLVPYLSDKNDRYFAMRALKAMGWVPGNDAAGANFWIEKGEYDRCVEIGGPAVEPLNSVIKSSAVEGAIVAAGVIGDDRSVDPLVSCLSSSSPKIRLEAAKALVSMYHSGKLSDGSKAIILARRSQMIEPHVDIWSGYSESSSNDCWHDDTRKHEDRGIGVTFWL